MINENFIIDMEHHYIPAEALKLVGKTSEFDYAMSLRKRVRAYEIMTDIEQTLKWMDESGITMAILSTAAFSSNGHAFCKVCRKRSYICSNIRRKERYFLL